MKQNVVGLQFHLEMTPNGARALVENCHSDLTPGPYVQAAQDILGVPREAYREANLLMSKILDDLMDACAPSPRTPTGQRRQAMNHG